MVTRLSQHIQLTIKDWPAIGKTVNVSIDRALHPSLNSMQDWLQDMYGPGKMVHKRSGQIIYERSISGPIGLWRLLLRALNKSY